MFVRVLKCVNGVLVEATIPVEELPIDGEPGSGGGSGVCAVKPPA